MSNPISDEEKKRVLRRLKKILALSESTNPGEAAAALHQADVLMKKYGLSSNEVELSEISEADSTLSSVELTQWETALFGVVSKALGVGGLFEGYRKPIFGKRPKGKIIFIGESCRATIAVYAFETLRRKLRSDMRDVIRGLKAHDGLHSLLKRKDRDMYAYGWCTAAMDKVKHLAPDVSPAITIYLENRSTVERTEKTKRKSRGDGWLSTYMAQAGYRDGKAVNVHQAVSASEEEQSLLN